METLPEDVTSWIARATGGEVTATRLKVNGGRLGYDVDIVLDGRPVELFLQRGRPEEASGGGLADADVEREAEVYRALEAIGVKAPHAWGASQPLRTLLLDRCEGGVWFQEPKDPAEQVTIAQDYIVQLARWHSTPASQMTLPSFGPATTARAAQVNQVAGIRRVFESVDAKAPIDRLAVLILDYLEKNIPDYDGPAVLCQGDTGPGNFLYKDGLVAGVVDWELAHLGDPMDDIAWLTWRATQHGFPDMPARLREYEQLSGNAIVPERVYYYRVNALARLGPNFGLPDMGKPRRVVDQVAADNNDRDASGANMITGMLHRRMYLTAIAAGMGYDFGSRDVDVEAPPPSHTGLYDNVLRQLQVMTPLIADKKASTMARGLARQVKYLKGLDRNADLFTHQEREDIAKLLGRPVDDLNQARLDLAEAARQDKVSVEGYLDYHWKRMRRDDHLMREASGKLFERGWPAIK